MSNHRLSVLPLLVTALAACAPEEQPPPIAPVASTGRFIASPVAGMDYVCDDLSGTTASDGAFQYYPGRPVEFRVGNVRIGAGPASDRMTLLDLVVGADPADVSVVNRAKFLMSLDRDGDSSNGIEITDHVANLVEHAMADVGLEQLDFNDEGAVNSVLFRVFVWATQLEGHELDVVDGAAAQAALKGMLLDENLYVARLSRDPDLANAHPNILVARNNVAVPDLGPNVLSTRQLVSTWSEEVPGTDAHDAYASISFDDGMSWRAYDLSRSAKRSSYTTTDGRELPGDTGPVAAVIARDKFLAAWPSQYCPSENPIGIEDDLYGATGKQGARAAAFAGPEMPYSCVWAIRGEIHSDGLHLRVPEQISSGLRDASQVRVAGSADVGFTIAWTEDADGIAGLSPAPGTDVWTSALAWDDFAAALGPYERVPSVAFSAPVRMTDNAACRYARPAAGIDEQRLPLDWKAKNRIEGFAYCDDEVVGVGIDGYGITEDGRILDGAAAATGLEIAMARQLATSPHDGIQWLGQTMAVWQENRGGRLDGFDARYASAAPFADVAVMSGIVLNRADRMGQNPHLAAQDVAIGDGGGTRFAIAYEEMAAPYALVHDLVVRAGRDGYDVNAVAEPVIVAGGEGRPSAASVALQGEHLAIAYTMLTPSFHRDPMLPAAPDGGAVRNHRDAYVQVSNDGGALFGTAVDVSRLDDGVNAQDPNVIWSMGTGPMLFATYGSRDGDLPGDLYFGRSADLGATFDTVPVVDPETGDASERFEPLAHGWPDESDARFAVAPDGDDLYAVWLQDSRRMNDVWFRPIAY